MKKLRVLHLFNIYLNTTENWAFRLISNLPNCEVVVASANFINCNFYSDKLTFLEFPLKQIHNPNKNIWISLLNQIILQIFKLYPYYVEKNCGQCDVIHSHFAPTGWQYLNLAKKLNVPYVVSFYGVDYESLPFNQPIWKKRYSQLFTKADMFICEGSHGVSILEKMGCPADKIHIVRLGVDEKKIPYWKRTKKTGELKLLQLASFTRKKGHMFTIKSFTRALNDCPNMSLTFVGPDKQGIKTELKNQINSTAKEKITFIDAIDFEHLYTFMKDYHVFIHPSCYSEDMDCEGGAPVVLLDAQATGMPIISTTHCDIPEEVLHGKTGLLSPEKDVDKLLDSIKIFYKMDQKEYEKYAENAKEHVINNYSVRNTVKDMKTLYEKLKNRF